MGESPPLTDRLTPVYPVTDGLQQPRLRKLVEQVMHKTTTEAVPDWLPPALLPSRLNLPLQEALFYLHQPPVNAPVEQLQDGTHPAQQRLAFEEMVAHHLSLLRVREQQKREPGIALPRCNELQNRFLDALPFHLTGAQQRVTQEIGLDLQIAEPMLRLVQGDVGSGKTVVAALACLQAIAHGKQAAMMAPTEILASQHFEQFKHWFESLGFLCVWLSSSTKAKHGDRRSHNCAGDGSAHIVIGTHALIQEDVQFHNLALVITDEQHRFGVRQRLALQKKGTDIAVPHQLIMTATPIPRTLAMTAYADLDCSIIDERPPGRTPVQTTLVIDNQRRDAVIVALARSLR